VHCKKKWRIINGKIVFDVLINGKRVYEFATYNKPFLTVFDEIINLFFVYEALQKRKKGFIIRCKFINLYFFQCAELHGRYISNPKVKSKCENDI
jgi:hypothetical protein